MARFTRRYPQLLDPLLKQMLGMVAVRPCGRRPRATCFAAGRAQGRHKAMPSLVCGAWSSETGHVLVEARREAMPPRLCSQCRNDACIASSVQAAVRPLARRQDFEAKLEAEEETASPPQPEAAPAGTPGLAPPSAGDQDDDEDAEQDDSAGSAAQAKWEVRRRDGQWPEGPSARCIGAAPVGMPRDVLLTICLMMKRGGQVTARAGQVGHALEPSPVCPWRSAPQPQDSLAVPGW